MYPTGRDHQSCEGDERNNSNSKQTDGRKEPPFNMPKQQTNSPQFGISYSQLGQPGYPIQSASGFSACGMNMPPNSHMQRLPTDDHQYNFRPQDQQCTRDECQPKKRLVNNGNSFVTTNTLLGRQIQLPNPPPQIGTISMGFGNAPFFVQPHLVNLIWSETGRSGTPITASETAYEMNSTANGRLFPSEYNQYINAAKYDGNQHFDARTQLFCNWPATTIPDPSRLGEPGLFYLGDRLCCFHCGGVLERKEMDGQFIEYTRCYLDYYNRQSIKKYPATSQLQSFKDVSIDNLTSLSLEDSESESLPNNINPDICGVCNTRKISVTQMNCRHIVCRQCLPKKDKRGKYRCRICQKEVVKTVAYDVSCLRV